MEGKGGSDGVFPPGAWEACKVSRCAGGRHGGRGSSVGRDPEAHNGLVFLKDVAWALRTSHDIDGNT